jgi:hypothetical protein
MVYTCGPAKPGTVLCPVRGDGAFLSYFDPIPAARGDTRSGYARFMVDGAAVYKFAVAPEHVMVDNPCKAVYVSPFPKGAEWFCVVKRCETVPVSQEECVDMPRGDPDGTRGVIQAYNNGPSDAVGDVPFGEIELQLPKGAPRGGRAVSTAVHELLGYVGSRAEIAALAKAALGVNEEPELYAPSA